MTDPNVKPRKHRGHLLAFLRDVFGDAACRAGHHEWTTIYPSQASACERCGAYEE